ncbi:hypothetical protein V5799_000776 [Amblyomma americanum]|uniref:Uncharacterized protein n=1 Tax=Amblyomma americanum TaxID=6943 RepID=A0AAQ4D228_AMBAM
MASTNNKLPDLMHLFYSEQNSAMDTWQLLSTTAGSALQVWCEPLVSLGQPSRGTLEDCPEHCVPFVNHKTKSFLTFYFQIYCNTITSRDGATPMALQHEYGDSHKLSMRRDAESVLPRS